MSDQVSNKLSDHAKDTVSTPKETSPDQSPVQTIPLVPRQPHVPLLTAQRQAVARALAHTLGNQAYLNHQRLQRTPTPSAASDNTGPQLPPSWLSDSLDALSKATFKTLTPVIEDSLTKLSTIIVSGLNIPSLKDVRLFGRSAGERLWELAKAEKGLGEVEHYRPLTAIHTQIEYLQSKDPSTQKWFLPLKTAFNSAAGGASSITFKSTALTASTKQIRILVTGFEPWDGGSNGAQPARPGTVNPSGAAALALDGQTIDISPDVTALIESIVLPVSFSDFKTGLVEKIVRPLLQAHQVDAILTVSLDPNLDPATDPTRIEQFTVGVHTESGLGAIPPEKIPSKTKASHPTDPAIIESTAPVEDIQKGVEDLAGRPSPALTSIGTGVTLKFATQSAYNHAQSYLAGTIPTSSPRQLKISDVNVLRTIISSMTRTDETHIKFKYNGQTFTAQVIEGPGGNFLSNEMSYRILRLLQQEKKTGVYSYHTHVPRATKNDELIPDKSLVNSPDEIRIQDEASKTRDQVIATLRTMISVVAKRIAARP